MDQVSRRWNRAASCARMSALAAVLALLSAMTILAYAGIPVLAVPSALLAISLGTVALLRSNVRRGTERGAVLATVSIAAGAVVITVVISVVVFR